MKELKNQFQTEEEKESLISYNNIMFQTNLSQICYLLYENAKFLINVYKPDTKEKIKKLKNLETTQKIFYNSDLYGIKTHTRDFFQFSWCEILLYINQSITSWNEVLKYVNYDTSKLPFFNLDYRKQDIEDWCKFAELTKICQWYFKTHSDEGVWGDWDSNTIIQTFNEMFIPLHKIVSSLCPDITVQKIKAIDKFFDEWK